MESSRIPFELILVTCVVIIFIWLLLKCVSGIWSALFGQHYVDHRPYVGESYTIPRTYFGSRKFIAIDTESVGAGPRGSISMLARVSLVTRDGRTFDRYVKPILPVTDYRTPYSGIREGDLVNGVEFETVRTMVAHFTNDCILVGHDLQHDLKSLSLRHPFKDTRDTSLYTVLRKMVKDQIVEEQLNAFWRIVSTCDGSTYAIVRRQARSMAEKLTEPKPNLKLLARLLLSRDIQTDEHDSLEDATAAMDLYKLVEIEWEVGVAYDNYDGCLSV